MPTDEPKPDMTDSDASAAAKPAKARRYGPAALIAAAFAIVIVLDVVAFLFFYPANPDNPAEPCAFPVCFIHGTLEFPAPEVLVGPQPPSGGLVIIFEPSITNTMFTMWIVSVGLLDRHLAHEPGRRSRARPFAEHSANGLTSPCPTSARQSAARRRRATSRSLPPSSY